MNNPFDWSSIAQASHFDTLKAAENLKAVGMSDDQARAVVNLIQSSQRNLVAESNIAGSRFIATAAIAISGLSLVVAIGIIAHLNGII